jgi:hypothetical protein
MANEGQFNLQLQFSKSGTTINKQKSANFTVTGTDYAAAVIDVTTGGGAITLPATIGTPGYAFFYNHDATNYVEVGNHNGGTPIYTARLKPGEGCLMRLTMAANAINLRANTATCRVEYVILED